MVFLKKFHAEGFKSFARPVTLNFNSTMIGIVGPNGSGKSNIVDALKWAMGEQSIKSLRGKEKSNLIFAGSNDLKEADFALVELTFDNSTRILHFDADEVKISRKLVKKSGENIYMINDEPCLLKDIQTTFIDAGLDKGSLGIISQGTVNWFAEAKPEDRRQMFESAAGIGKYIKQKNETENHLQKAMDNLERLNTTLSSLRRDVKELNRQAEKAQQYKEKTEQLKKYDISVTVQDYLTWKDEYAELEQKIAIEKTQLDELEISVNKAKELKDKFELEYINIDNKVRTLNNQKSDLQEQISQLNVKRATYMTNLENKISSGTIQERKESYQILINTEQEKLNSWQQKYIEAKKEAQEISNVLEQLETKREEFNAQANDIQNEYSNKKYRYEELERQFNNSNSHERGVSELLKVKDRIGGIHSTIQNIIKVKERYEVAIQTALGKSISNLVVENDDIAVKAINYLKQNRCGRATFLPLNTIKAKEISPATLTIMNQAPGFIDVASNLVGVDDRYKNVIASILGNVGVTDTIENANLISKMIRSTYKLISLDGDVVFAGGALAGGQSQQGYRAVFNIEQKLLTSKDEFNNIKKEYEKFQIDKTQNDYEINQWLIKKQSNDSIVDKLDNNIKDSQIKLTNYKNDYEALEISDDESTNNAKINEYDLQIIELNNQFNKIEQELKEAEKIKELSFDQNAKYSSEYNNCQNQSTNLIKIHAEHNNKFNNLDNQIKNADERIANTYGVVIESVIEEYNKPLNVTIAEARRIIATLKAEINALGNINFQALESLEQKEAELKNLEKETTDAKDSVTNLSNLLTSLDKRAKADFLSVINKVNEIIPGVFKSLFGGGHCEIKIVDPQNILESGIDIIAQPPGKKITNLVLLSGGEKTLIALAVLFSLLKSSHFPLVLLDEAEAALDQTNVNTFAKLIQEFSDQCQFLVITHRTGTMKMCDVLYGTMMKVKGVTNVIKVDYNSIKNKDQVKNS